jgi:radical SAM superfamily enzyme YgiQ (UPF0313 family)
MNIDLLVPRFPPAHWNFAFAMDLEGSLYSHPPLGVATLAAYTPEGVTVRIFDENVENVDLGALGDVVGISAMYIQRGRAFELAAALRARGKKVVFGGSLVSALPEQCARRGDVLFHGEAEHTWPRFLQDLERGEAAPSYSAPERFDLATSRTPRFDLLELGRYSTGSIQTSRGCPFACSFCDVPFFDGPVSRTKTVEQVMIEVELLHAAGQRSIFFVDDHFLGSRKLALKLLPELARFSERVRYKTLFYCQATLNVAKDDELLELLYRANFRRLFIGIESDDAVALKNINKPHNTTLPVAEAVRRIQKHNITVWAALLAGFDEDRADVFRRYLAFAQSAKIGMVIPGLLQAVPGTPYYDDIERQGRILRLKNGYVGGQSGSLDSLLVTNVKPRNMTHDELLTGYRRFVRELYEHDAYAERVIGFLDAGERPELGALEAKDLWAVRGILARVFRYYLAPGDPARRRFFLSVVRHLLKTRMRRADEAVFHLVIYKHLREFYFQTSDAAVPVAEDLEPLGPSEHAA